MSGRDDHAFGLRESEPIRCRTGLWEHNQFLIVSLKFISSLKFLGLWVRWVLSWITSSGLSLCWKRLSRLLYLSILL